MSAEDKPSIKLIIEAEDEPTRKYHVDRDITIGRDPSNDLVLEDSAVSLVHCQILFDKDVFFVKDLGSTNGTKVNSKRIINTRLTAGDEINIGHHVIKVEARATLELPLAKTIVHRDDEDMDDEAGPVTPHDTTVLLPSRKDELSGSIFGSVHYYLKRKIADGGMGAVYEAEQFGAEGFIKKVAIKTILPRYVQHESFVASFVGEAKLVANLVHQNIVQIHHLGRHEQGYYISMEYIDGINLTQFLASHFRVGESIPVDIATFIVSRVSRGLQYAHNKRDDEGHSLNLVHRDVSPNNLMITREGEVKLTDFGVAKVARFMDAHEECLVGSVEYMSPEQAACQTVDARSDIFSLGLVYYELLTGVRIFECRDDNIDNTVERVKQAHVPPLRQYREDVSDGVVTILTRCLQKDPRDRYWSAGELSYALEHELYSKGYGPTIVALSRYMADMRRRDPDL